MIYDPPLRRFMARTAALAAIVSVLLSIAELMVRRVETAYDVKREAVAAFGTRTGTLLLGHSHFHYGVIADSLPHTVNLTMPYQNPEYDYRVLRRFIGSMPSLRRVVVSIGWFSFFDPPVSAGDCPGAEAAYKIHYGINKYSDFSPHNLELSYPSLFKNKLRQIFGIEEPPHTTPKGFGTGYASSAVPADLMREAPVTAGRHRTMHLGHEAYNLAWTDSLVELCAERDIELIFVSAPVSRPYSLEMATSDERLRTLEIIDSLVAIRRLRYIDFTDDRRFTDADFHDPDHLSREGALKFTAVLGDTLDLNPPGCVR